MKFIVTHDIFMTPTARYSDIILPVSTFLERADAIVSGDNRLFYSTQAINPVGDILNDYDILSKLAYRLGFGKKFTEGRTAEEWLNYLIKQSKINDIDRFKKTGCFVGKEQKRVAFSEFIKNPKRFPLKTRSGKIEIKSQLFSMAGFSAIPTVRIYEPNERYPLKMITPHSKYLVNSQNYNLNWTGKIMEKTLMMNNEDGLKRGLQNGSWARVESEQGVMEIKITLTKDIIAGCAVLYQGGWTNLDENGVEKGNAANSLTAARPTLPSYGSRTHLTFVEVRER